MSFTLIRPLGSLLAVTLFFGGCLATKKAEPAPAENAEPVGIVNTSAAPEVEPVPLPMTPKPEVSEPKAHAEAKPVPAEPEVTEEEATAEPEVPAEPVAVKAPTPVPPFEHYTVKLTPNGKAFNTGDVLTMRVDIKAPEYPVKGNEAHGVQVTFSGLQFVENQPAVECLRVHPNGSEAIYNVKVKEPGVYRITANIAVSPTRECQIVSTYKTSAPIVVTVD